jgi:hypothetical protein
MPDSEAAGIRTGVANQKSMNRLNATRIGITRCRRLNSFCFRLI